MKLYYYQVMVASPRYHGKEYLTYSYSQKLAVGSIVEVPLQKQQVLSVIYKQVSKPSFNTKNIDVIYDAIPPIPTTTISLMDWLFSYYPSSLGSLTQLFLPKNLPINKLSDIQDEPDKLNSNDMPTLTRDQHQAIGKIGVSGTYLLHGETGSGKTRLYQELALSTVKDNKSVIILTPEISLTSQLNKNFKAIFGNRVLVIHSQLTEVERRKAWLRILTSTTPIVIIGTRSALFSPLKNIGLIVIDEAHESAYKQEQAPHYHAVRVASKMASLHKAIMILGSATPSVVDYSIAEQKHIPILRMSQLATKSSVEDKILEVVDMKDKNKFTKDSYISDKLIEAVGQTLNKNEQVLIFLNRRGTARVILCDVCGWQAICPNCDTPLTYHGDDHTMRCHTCSFKTLAVSACPVCKNTNIVFKSVGTKAIVDKLQKQFPDARIQRFDTDNKKVERFEQHYHDIVEGKIDILVGTQTLAKGLDLPRLSLVGVITADTSLYTPDYTAQERMYQLISQVIGRVGRGHIKGNVIVQTYSPDNHILESALSKDWDSFYKNELNERRTYMFPPFCYLLKLTCRRTTQVSANKAATNLADKLKNEGLKITVNGPAPAFHERLGRYFEWQLVIKSKNRADLLNVIKLLPSGWSYDIDPTNLL